MFFVTTVFHVMASAWNTIGFAICDACNVHIRPMDYNVKRLLVILLADPSIRIECECYMWRWCWCWRWELAAIQSHSCKTRKICVAFFFCRQWILRLGLLLWETVDGLHGGWRPYNWGGAVADQLFFVWKENVRFNWIRFHSRRMVKHIQHQLQWMNTNWRRFEVELSGPEGGGFAVLS